MPKITIQVIDAQLTGAFENGVFTGTIATDEKIIVKDGRSRYIQIQEHADRIKTLTEEIRLLKVPR